MTLNLTCITYTIPGLSGLSCVAYFSFQDLHEADYLQMDGMDDEWGYPLVNLCITVENHHAFMEKQIINIYKCSFSIAMLSFQRVPLF